MPFRCLQTLRKKIQPRNPQLESTYSKFKDNIEIHILKVTNISLIIIYLAILIVGFIQVQNIPFRVGFFSAALLALLARKISMHLSKFLIMGSFITCLIFVIYNSTEFVVKGIPQSYFLYGNAIGIVEFMIVLSIKNTIVKVAFILANCTIKVVSYTKNFTPSMIIVFASVMVLSIIFYIYYDYLERRNFKIIYDSREESRKFQSLLSNDFPMSVVIMSSDFQSVLYSNNFFKQKFRNDTSKEAISAFFDKFTITFNPQIQKFDSSLRSHDISFSDFAKNLSTSADAFKDEDSYVLSATLNQGDEEFHYEIRIRRMLWDLQPAFTVIFNDISDKQTVMALKFADEQKDKVIATVSHELRTPINGILGLLEMIKVRISDEISLAYLENCKSCSNLLLYLVNSILDLSQLRNHTLNIVKCSFNISQLLEEVRTLYLFQSQQKNIDFVIKNEAKDLPFIYTDKHRLIEILINLLGNAFKFTFKGSITLQVTPDEENADKLIFSVIDTGIGIKQEDMPKLFKMFGKIPQADKNINSHGAGLGLAIVNELVRTLNNDGDACFTVESEYEKGTTFSFKINVNDALSPLTRENMISEEDSACKEYDSLHEMVSNKIERMTSSQDIYHFITVPTSYPVETIMTEPHIEFLPTETEIKERQNIMVVDDNPFNILAITFILEKFKYNVSKACSGEECLKMLDRSVQESPRFNLILMDIQMPILDGLETSKIINQRIQEGKLYEVPVVALTATKLTESVKEEYKQNGMFGWLEKPLNEKELNKILKSLGWK